MAATSPTTKAALLMAEDERRRLMQIMLDINTIAMATFDCLEANLVSENDILTMVKLPDLVNDFTLAMTIHAKRRIARGY